MDGNITDLPQKRDKGKVPYIQTIRDLRQALGKEEWKEGITVIVVDSTRICCKGRRLGGSVTVFVFRYSARVACWPAFLVLLAVRWVGGLVHLKYFPILIIL